MSVVYVELFSVYANVQEIPPPATSNKMCQAVPVFLTVISNRGLSHSYSCPSEGYRYISF